MSLRALSIAVRRTIGIEFISINRIYLCACVLSAGVATTRCASKRPRARSSSRSAARQRERGTGVWQSMAAGSRRGSSVCRKLRRSRTHRSSVARHPASHRASSGTRGTVWTETTIAAAADLRGGRTAHVIAASATFSSAKRGAISKRRATATPPG